MRGQLAIREMPYNNLKEKRVLEIGCGGGAHSALFKRKGANVTAVDLTAERVNSTALKLKMIPGKSKVLQADAEQLPFEEKSFDIVYSNGVLHHSQNTESCVAEAWRVLKPSGRIVLMLYARHSTMFWTNLLIRALFNGSFFKEPEETWLGKLTEGKPKYGSSHNPYTRVYSAKEIKSLLSKFSEIKIRKSSFRLDYLPIPKGTKIRNWILGKLGYKYSNVGTILYGAPIIEDSNLEIALSPYLGWCLNICAKKTNKPKMSNCANKIYTKKSI